MKSHMTTWFRVSIAAIATLVLTGALAPASFASGPKLKLNLDPPTYVSAGETIGLQIAIQNVGNQPTSGPIAFSDTASPDSVPRGTTTSASRAGTTCRLGKSPVIPPVLN